MKYGWLKVGRVVRVMKNMFMSVRKWKKGLKVDWELVKCVRIWRI